MVNRVVPDGDVAMEAAATADRICAGAPLVNRWHKKFANKLARSEKLSPDDQAEGFACFDTDDFKTGYQAFLSKTKPNFEGS